MTTTRSSVPPAPERKEIPGPAKAKPRGKEIGKKPEPDRLQPSLAELKARQPFPGSFSDTYPEATEEDFEGACDCWGDNNPRLTEEERKETEGRLGEHKAPYDLGN